MKCSVLVEGPIMNNNSCFLIIGISLLLHLVSSFALAADVALLGVGNSSGGGQTEAASQSLAKADPLTGKQAQRPKDWVGKRKLSPQVPILIMAGHADSQNIEGGGGTSGLIGHSAPMNPSIRDELHWNLLVAQEVVRQGKQRGLKIEFYDPPERTIQWADDPRTTWSKGREHVLAGGYALEIHFDAYGNDGYGSGLIPSIQVDLRQPPAEGEESTEPSAGDIRPMAPSIIDEELAREFGRYEAKFRDGLGGPMRGISLLEVGQLQPPLETALRSRPTETVQLIAKRIVDSFCRAFISA